MKKWLIICSNCGGCTKESVLHRLVQVLGQVVGGENSLTTQLVLQRVPVVNSLWLIDSVTNYHKLDYKDYMIEMK